MRHEGLLWEVDSQKVPKPMDRQSLEDVLRKFQQQRCPSAVSSFTLTTSSSTCSTTGITKYGAGMSVNARVASLLDDIISRVPEGRTMTVAPLLAKAFIATAVPDSLCCLEAWHILWGLPRTVASRYFRGLNMDGLTGVKKPKEVPKAGTKEAEEHGTQCAKRTVIQMYADRMDLPCQDEELKAALHGYCLLRFSAELDFEQKKGFKKTGAAGRFRPRVMNLKPYLQLDVTTPAAAKHAKMALRMLRP